MKNSLIFIRNISIIKKAIQKKALFSDEGIEFTFLFRFNRGIFGKKLKLIFE